jgi:hypothetical protein
VAHLRQKLEGPLRAWFKEAEHAQWATPADEMKGRAGAMTRLGLRGLQYTNGMSFLTRAW